MCKLNEFDFKGTDIKGKNYVEVNERIKAFRTCDEFKGWSMETNIENMTESFILMKAIIKDTTGRIISTGFAQEDRDSSKINATNYIENCETSAWGRALANLGIGIDTSVASSNEVYMAVKKQEGYNGYTNQHLQNTAQNGQNGAQNNETVFDKITGENITIGTILAFGDAAIQYKFIKSKKTSKTMWIICNDAQVSQEYPKFLN